MSEAKKAKAEKAILLTNEIFDIVDEDGNGSMDFDEFCRWAKSDGAPDYPTLTLMMLNPLTPSALGSLYSQGGR